jgi:hypothetical protein
MFVVFSSTITIVGAIEYMICMIDQISLMLTDKFSIRSQKLRLIHRPLLNGMLFLITMMMSISGAPIGVKIISIRMKIVPSCHLCSRNRISFMEGAMCAVCLVSETHRMLVEFSYRDHLLELSVIREMVLNKGKITAWVVTP